MYTIENIMKIINRDCLVNNGVGFDVSNLYLEFSWTKKYVGKKTLFGKIKWSYEGADVKNIMEIEMLLSKLPKGISFSKNNKLTSKLPDEAKQYISFYEYYLTTYTIHVSDSYSRRIVGQNNGRKIVVIGDFDKKTMHAAERFKAKVLSAHKGILDPLFKNGFSKGYALINSGFTDFDGSGYSLSKVGMKPLQNEAQRLGLMLALGEYGESAVPSDEIWFIDNPYNESIRLSRDKIKTPEILNEW